MEALLTISNVSKSFGDLVALDQINLEIRSGEVVGLVGSNGAGKTTLLRLMAGVYLPTSGKVSLPDGKPVDTMRQSLGGRPRIDWIVFEAHCLGKHSIPFENAWHIR